MRVLAIDGPAGSGKSTVARAVAVRIGIRYLDTGAMYRAVTALALRRNVDVHDSAALVALVERAVLHVGLDTVSIDGLDVTEEIRGPAVTAAVSVVAADPAVRAALVAQQRAWVATEGGGVLEGRDIGTVVFPDAPLKVYLTASNEARAARRAAEGVTGDDRAAVAADLARRDRLDSSRATAPLAVADDAVVLDTTELSIEQVVDAVVALWNEREVPAVTTEIPDAAAGRTATESPGAAAIGSAAAAVPAAAPTVSPSARLDSAWNVEHPSRATRAFYGVVRAILVGFCYSWFRMEVRGKEHVPTSGGFILAPVHRSNLDTPIVAAVTRRPMRFMGKDSLWKANAAFAWVISALGAFPVARGSADRDALRRCQTVLEAGQPLVLYPEGTRQLGPTLHELFDGPAFLALRTGLPIIPVGIGGSERAQRKGSKFIRPTKVRVLIGAPIVPERTGEGRATSRRAVRELTDRLRVDLQALFDQARAGLPT